MTESTVKPGTDRRGFLKRSVTTVLGLLLGSVPIGAGLGVFFAPIRRRGSQAKPVQVCWLDALPSDGVPHLFPVIATRRDAWNTYPATKLGMVFLRRTGEDKVEAFNAVCPHAGCIVGYQPKEQRYLCPCHQGAFTLDGHRVAGHSPARRGLDSLEVEIRAGGQVWVLFQNYLPGRADRVPLA